MKSNKNILYTIIKKKQKKQQTVLYFINNQRKCYSYYSKPVNEDLLNKL